MDTIVFHYRGKTSDGEVFFDSHGREPFELKVGMHMVMPALEEALVTMSAGETKSVPVGKAYGDYDQSALQKHILKETIENGHALEEGMEIMWTSPNNPDKPIPAKIVRADEYSFDIDFNHPLAGKELVYEVEVLDVR